MVCPPTLSAATPVDASTTTFFLVRSRKCSSSVDLPVPAFPVIKICFWLVSRKSRIDWNSSFISVFIKCYFVFG